MPSSYTTRNRLTKQATGEGTNTWGDILNTGAFDLVDFSLDGLTTKALTADYSLTSVNGTTDESRARALKLTGTGSYTVTIPSVQKLYFVWNELTGNATLTTGSGATAVIPTGAKTWVVSDGTNVYPLGYSSQELKTYIDAAILATTGSLPATTGNNGKAIICVAGAWTPTLISPTYLDSWTADATATRLGTTDTRALTPDGVYDAFAEVTLTDAGSVAVDMSTFINARVTLGGNRILANPTNAKPGQSGYIAVVQDATGSRTLSYGANWKRSGGAPVLTTTAFAVDYIFYTVITSSLILYDLVKNPT